MANAIKKISVQRGYDIRQYVLNCFGGAAGQHACLVADTLGIKKILIHPLAGVLSAYGMGLADISVMREQAVEKELKREMNHFLKSAFEQLEDEVLAELKMQEDPIGPIRPLSKRYIHLRYLALSRF